MQTKILMVCLGNICRSPIAEGILFSKLPEDAFIVASAGTGNWHVGQHPDLRSIAISKKYGIDIANQKCQRGLRFHTIEKDLIEILSGWLLLPLMGL